MDDYIHFYSPDNVIILTGNGFDLACGLETSYDHFFNYLKENKQVCNVDLCSLLSDNNFEGIYIAMKEHENLSVWECYFASKYNEIDNQWANIEAEIEKSLSTGEFWSNILSTMKHIVLAYDSEKHKSLNKDSLEDIIALIMLCRYKDHFVILPTSGLIAEHGKQYLKDDYYLDALKNELHIFENKFGAYLKSMDLIHGDYLKVRDENLTNIKNLFRGVPFNADYNYRLITFNYTGNLISEGEAEEQKRYRVFNEVHGNIENPIFGMRSGVKSSLGYIETFSKNSRRRLANLPTYFDILDRNQKYNLVICGTSFETSDYDDFKVLLNYVGPNDTVVVIYDLFDGREERREEIYHSVMRMYINLGFAEDEDDFWLKNQMGEIIFKELPTTFFKKIKK